MAGLFQNEEVVNAVIRVRRGKDSERLSTQFEDGELVYTTDKKRLYIGDGLGINGSVGGNLVGNKIWYTNNFQNLTGNIERYDMVYRYDSEGFYVLIGDQPTNATSYILVGGNELLPDLNLTIPLQEEYIPKASTVTRGGVKIGKALAVRVDGSLDVSYNTDQLNLDNTTNQLGINMPVVKKQIASPAGYDILGTVDIIPGKGLNIDNNTGRLYINLDLDTLKLSSFGSNTVIYGDPHKASYTEHGVVKFQTNYIGYTSPFLVSNGLLQFGYDNTTLKVNNNGIMYVDIDEFRAALDNPNQFYLYINNSQATLQKLNIDRDYWNVTNTGDLEINTATDSNLGVIQIGTGLSASDAGYTIVSIDNNTLTARNGGIIAVNEIASVSSKFTGYIRRNDGFTTAYGVVTAKTDATLNTVIFQHPFAEGCGPITISIMHPTLTDCVATIRSIDKTNFTFVAKSSSTTVTVSAFWHAYGLTSMLTV
jgi:hypothetical protein